MSMKMDHDFIVIDLEATADYDADGNKVHNDIIQIGAVLLDRDLNEIISFDSLVRSTEKITPFITKLTGITDDQAVNAPTFIDVIKSFNDKILSKVVSVRNVHLCAWGTYFDIPLLRKAYMKHKLQYPFTGTALDIKTLAMLWMHLAGYKTNKLSVRRVAKVMNIMPDGNLHNALVDARVEAKIMRKIFYDIDDKIQPI